jgi:pimeloyl-ACP methyl ester carboxylesterase
MTTFALVHGAWHGSWCWEEVAPLLQKAGHHVVAPELPCDDGSATTFEPYADLVCAALEGRDADVVVVAHSLAGPTGTLIAARRPVRHLVYVCAVVPAPGLSLVDQGGEMVNPDWDKGLSQPDAELRTVWVDRDMAKALCYHDCDESTVTAAFSRLRPQSAYPFIAAFPLSQLPTVSCTYVACAEDRLIDPDWQVQTARNIGASLEVIPSSHSPFFSQPRALTDALLRAAAAN